MMLRARTAALALAALLAVSAQAAPVERALVEGPPPIPSGRSLSSLAASEHVLVALRPEKAAERLVVVAGGRLVSAALDLWQIDGTRAAWLVPRLARQGLLRYAEPDHLRLRHDHLDQGDPLISAARSEERRVGKECRL